MGLPPFRVSAEFWSQSSVVSKFPPDGYLTCFEAYLMQCYLCFPLPEAVVRLFGRFGLLICQVNPCNLQHLVRILVLSYERGMTLDIDHLEGLLIPQVNSDIVQLGPRNNMAIITGFASNFHSWKKYFFFLCVNNASVEGSCIPIFRTRWGRRGIPDRIHASFGSDDIQPYAFASCFAVTNPLPPTSDGLLTVRDLLRGSSFYWASFTLKWVCLALSRSILSGLEPSRHVLV